MTRNLDYSPKNHGIYNTGSVALWRLADVFIERGMSVKPLAASRENFDLAHEIQRAAEIVQAHERPAWDVDAAIDRLIAGWMATAECSCPTADAAGVGSSQPCPVCMAEMQDDEIPFN